MPRAGVRGSVGSRRVLAAWAAVVTLLPWAGATGAAPGAPTEGTALKVTGMTFVGSRTGVREMVLRSREAWLRPGDDEALLSEVEAEVTDPEDGRHFTMTCARVDLDIASNDFLAEGDVQGSTSDGQRYRTEWVRYRHEEGLVFTDAPVEVTDARGRFRGDGFRYHVDERRFELIGNVRVEQTP